MNKPISSSPQRHTFQDTDPDRNEFWETVRKNRMEQDQDPEWQKDNMEYDLRTTEWILDKVRGDDVYAQNLYAAMCNREFTKNDVWPLLTGKRWGCSWRYAGGIIADMQQKGDYIDWYCSGIRDTTEISEDEFNALTKEQQEFYLRSKAYVGESVVTDEIREDLLKLGWIVLDDEMDQQ